MSDDPQYAPAVVARTERGYFAPGVSGNPNGRPTLPKDVRRMLEDAAPKAVERLIALIDSSDERVAAACSTAVLDRLFGKPAQAVDKTVTPTNVQEAHLRALQAILAGR